MKKVYLLTIVDKAYNEYSDQVVFHSVYQDKGLAKHYMLKDIVEQFEKGRIKNLDGIVLDNDVYVNKDMYINNNIIWKIEAVNFYDGII